VAVVLLAVAVLIPYSAQSHLMVAVLVVLGVKLVLVAALAAVAAV
jgi:hypothetical protein